MKAATTNVIQKKVSQTQATGPACPTIDPSKEPDLLSPEMMIFAKKRVKLVLYGMVMVGIPLAFWFFIGTDYAMVKDKFAWIAMISVLGIFFIKFITNDLGWKSIMTTFKWFAIISILLIVGKEFLYHEQAEIDGKQKSSAVGFSVIDAGKATKAKIAEMIKEAKEERGKAQRNVSDYKIYQPGTYTFNLKAGEITDHWIKLPRGVIYGIESKEDKFRIIFRDNYEIRSWEGGRLPNNKGDFKLSAVVDQLIKLKVE